MSVHFSKHVSNAKWPLSRMLANRGILLPDIVSLPPSVDVKRQHRKAVMSGDGMIGPPQLPPRDEIVRRFDLMCLSR